MTWLKQKALEHYQFSAPVAVANLELINKLCTFLLSMDEFGTSTEDDTEIVSSAHMPSSLTLGTIREVYAALWMAQAPSPQ